MRKIVWLLVNNIQVTISVTLKYFTWQMKGQALQLYWMKIWHVNENWAVSLLPVKSSLYSHLNWRTWPESKRELPCGFDAAFFTTVFRVVKKNSVPCSSLVYLGEETLQPAQVAPTKMPKKSTKKRIFLVLKDIYYLHLVASWLKLLHWTLYRLDLRLSRFVCELSNR